MTEEFQQWIDDWNKQHQDQFPNCHIEMQMRKAGELRSFEDVVRESVKGKIITREGELHIITDYDFEKDTYVSQPLIGTEIWIGDERYIITSYKYETDECEADKVVDD